MYLHKKVSGYRKADGSLSHSFDDYTEDEFGASNSVTIVSSVGYWRKANAIHKWFVENVQDGEDNCEEYDVSLEKLRDLLETCMKVIKAADGETITIDPSMEEDVKKFDWLKDCPKSFVFDASNLDAMAEKLRYVHQLPKTFATVAANTLPSVRGFFFGNTDYDGGYLETIIKTARMVKRLLDEYEKLPTEEKRDVEFTYQASW